MSTFGRRSPLVVSLLLHFGLLPPCAGGPCCFKIQPQSRTGHAHQLGLHAVWPVLRRFSAPIPGRLLLSANRAEFCPTLPFVYGCLNTLSINSKFLSNSRDILSHPSTRPLFGGFHCFGYSSGKGCGCRRPIKGCGLPPRAGGLCCFKFIRILVWGTRTNSARKRSGRCYADIRLLFLDAYYCQPIARDSVPSARLGFPVSLPSTTVAAAVLAPPRQLAAPPPGLYPGSRPTPRRFASRASWARLGSLEPPHQSPRRPSCARAGRARRYAAVLRL